MDELIKNRIEHILEHLLPATGLKTRFKAPQTLRDRMAYYHTPGVSIAVINDFELEWALGFGLADVRTNRKVTTETLFQAGSISKPIFALGVMRLFQEGKVNLDEDIHRYLSSWHLPANEGWQPRISLRQLLSHTAGLTVGGFQGYQVSETLPTVPQILNGEYPANSAKVEANILPGIKFRYSGGGTTVAQQVLVDLLNKPFPQIMHELIFEPLGMTHSTFEQPLPNHWAKRAATAYTKKGIPLKGRFHTYPEMAAAGLWTTPTDLAKAGVELLKILHDKKAYPLLTKETIETMLRPQLDHQKMDEGSFVGLGFFCDGKEEAFRFGHAGLVEGFVADMRLYKNFGKGSIVLVNSNEGNPLLDEITRAIAIEYDWPDALPEDKSIANLANIYDYTGFYTSDTGIQFRVSIMDNKLLLHYGEQPPLPIFPSSEADFFTKAINADIRFEKDDSARIISLTITQEGHPIKALKQISAGA